MSIKKILIAAGGTGGHVFPGLAVAEALRARGIQVEWLGTAKGLDANLVPKAGIPFHAVPIQGLRGKGFLSLFFAPYKILRALFYSLRIIRSTQAELVLGMGGYVSGPAGVASWLLRKPLVIHEQNAVAGLTNRWLAKIASEVLQAFPNTFKPSIKPKTTGNPVRLSIAKIQQFLPHDPLHVLVLGGSQGAQAMNAVMPALSEDFSGKIMLWHQTGEKWFSTTERLYKNLGKYAGYPRVEPFIDDMSAAYAWADLLICRAGALTVAEVAAAGVPAIFIPFPAAVDDHQTANARYLTEAGAAWLLPQKNLNVERLKSILNEILLNSQQLVIMSQRSQALAKRDATDRVIEELLNVCVE